MGVDRKLENNSAFHISFNLLLSRGVIHRRANIHFHLFVLVASLLFRLVSRWRRVVVDDWRHEDTLAHHATHNLK